MKFVSFPLADGTPTKHWGGEAFAQEIREKLGLYEDDSPPEMVSQRNSGGSRKLESAKLREVFPFALSSFRDSRPEHTDGGRNLTSVVAA